MNISKSDLVSALKKAMPGVETGNALLEGADTFIFSNNFVFTYNDAIAVRAPLSGDLTGALKAKELFGIVNKIQSETLTIIPGDKSWQIIAGDIEAELNTVEAGVFAKLADIVESEWEKTPADFIDGVNECKFSSNKSALSGIFVKDVFIYATDEVRVNRYKMDGVMKQFWISDPSAGELLKLGGVTDYQITNSWVNFKTADNTILSIKRLADGKFPAEKIHAVAEQHVATPTDIVATIPAALQDAVDRASALSMSVDSHDSVKISFSPAEMVVSSARSTGKYKETVKWAEAPGEKFPTADVYVDLSMVTYGMKRSRSLFIREVEKNGKINRRLVFFSDKVIHIVNTFVG